MLNLKKRKFISNFFFLLSSRSIDIIFPIIILPILTDRLGMDNYGKVAFAISISLYLGVFLQYGFILSGTRAIASAVSDPNRVKKVFGDYFWATHFLAILISFFAIPIYFVFFSGRELVLFLSAFFYIIFFSLIPLWYFQGVERFKIYAFVNSLGRIGYGVGIYIFIKKPEDYSLVTGVNFISIFFVYLILMLIAFVSTGFCFEKTSFSSFTRLLKLDFWIFVNNLTPNLYNNFSIFYLGVMHGMAYVGIFSIAMTISEGAFSLVKVLTNILYPAMFKNKELIGRFSKVLLLIILLGVFLYYYLLPYTVTILFNENVDIIILCCRILSLAIIFGSIYLFYGLLCHMVYGEERKIVNITIVVSMLSFLVSLLLIPVFALWGALFVVCLARVLLGSISLYLYNRDLKYERSNNVP